MAHIFDFETKEDAMETMLRSLNTNGIHPFLSMDLYKEENEVREFAKFYEFGGFKDKHTYESIVKNTLVKHMAEIAEWLLSNRKQTDIFEFIEDGDGYVIGVNDQKRNAKSIHMKLRKDRENVTEFGFFISSCIPE